MNLGRTRSKPLFLAFVAALSGFCLAATLFLTTSRESLPRATSEIRDAPPKATVADLVLNGIAAKELCARYRLEPFDATRVKRRKIYDLIMVNTETDMLEVRMGQMYPYVDYFVVLESDTTFSGKPKKLFVRDAESRFAPYRAKMILRTMSLEGLAFDGTTWDREKHSRNAAFSQVVPFLTGDQAPEIDDVLLVSDVDELVKPGPLRAMRNCVVPLRTSVASTTYYYGYQWRSRWGWSRPQATLYRAKDTITPHALRTEEDKGYHLFQHGGWHCSYCFSTIEETLTKLSSFSHSELDVPQYRDPSVILQRVRFGIDFYDRRDDGGMYSFDFVADNRDVPDFLERNADKFAFMLDRSPANANYLDVFVNSTIN